MLKWYQEKNGDVSAMRIMVVPGGWIALAVIIAGTVGIFLDVPDSIALAGVGSGLFTVASGVKAWQKGKED
jgi:hypothetical protein